MSAPTITSMQPPELYDRIVNISVGPGEDSLRSFATHHGLFSFHSGAYDGSPYIEEIELSHGGNEELTDAGLFYTFHTWMYTQKLVDNEQSLPRAQIQLPKLCRLWMLGCLLKSPIFQDTITDAIMKIEAGDFVYQMWYVYGRVNHDTALLRAALIDSVILKNHWRLNHFSATDWPPAALADLIPALWAGNVHSNLPLVNLRSLNFCWYHHHTKDEECLV